ncbi:glycosyltransferase family 4 protein [Petroclostridium xylanilyticum]|uniref:glycosyltransferase family 4 protein n=1 Tax=Petroclostridium xylanilyticum TaxID=1792311 RepID=UPI000B986CE1|nr:glycosyltransferase family 4 protein [Petroclostridium xylanilyticum]
MNILHLTTFLQGGAGRIIYELALAQHNMGYHVTVITGKTSEPGYCNYDEYIEGLKDNGVCIYQIDSMFKRELHLNLEVAGAARDIIYKNNIDIIHAHAAIPGFVGVIARSGKRKYIPVLQTMHGWGTNKSLLHEKMDIIIMNGLDQIVAVSKSDKNLLEEKGVDREKIKVIYNGVTESNVDVGGSDETLLEIKSFKEKGFKVIGCIGTVCERKNQSLLLDVFNQIVKTHKAVCVFIGEGDLIPVLEERAAQYGVEQFVKFYGYKQNASKYLREFDCLVLPSNSEGLPLTVLEAFREKVPVIASNIPIFKEIIDDRHTGYLFKANDATSLMSILGQVLSTLKKDTNFLVEVAYGFYEKCFSTKAMIENYNNLYLDLVSR